MLSIASPTWVFMTFIRLRCVLASERQQYNSFPCYCTFLTVEFQNYEILFTYTFKSGDFTCLRLFPYCYTRSWKFAIRNSKFTCYRYLRADYLYLKCIWTLFIELSSALGPALICDLYLA